MHSDWPNTFKTTHLNAENLFLYLDEPLPTDWRSLTEKAWQGLSRATVSNKPLGKSIWLGETLLHLKPDLITLNEVGGLESIARFAKYFLNDQYTPYLIEGNSDRGIDVGFLLKKGLNLTAELRTHKQRPLDLAYPHETNKTYYFSRDCAELRLYSNSSETPALIVLAVHLKSKLDPLGIDNGGKLRREAEAKLLTKIYTEIRAEFSQPVPVMICGDFNGNVRPPENDPEFDSFLKSDVISVAELAELDAEARVTQYQFSRTSGARPVQIDYIFISPELSQFLLPKSVQSFRYLSDRVPLPPPRTLEQRTYLPSDHYPVVAAFKNFIS